MGEMETEMENSWKKSSSFSSSSSSNFHGHSMSSDMGSMFGDHDKMFGDMMAKAHEQMDKFKAED